MRALGWGGGNRSHAWVDNLKQKIIIAVSQKQQRLSQLLTLEQMKVKFTIVPFECDCPRPSDQIHAGTAQGNLSDASRLVVVQRAYDGYHVCVQASPTKWEHGGKTCD